jgi:hypothetical protein
MPSPYDQQLKSQSGGVQVGVVRLDGSDIVHVAALGKWLREFIEESAKVHDTDISDEGFNNVIAALAANKIQAYFLIVGWENCQPQFAGGAIQYPTVITEWNGNSFEYYPAIYYEDTYVLPELSAEYRARISKTKAADRVGLGTYFRRERIKFSVTPEDGGAPFGMISRGLIGECSSDNAPSIHSLKKLRAVLGDAENAVLQLNDIPSTFIGRRGATLTTYGLSSPLVDAAARSNVFVTKWSSGDGEQQLAATFTEAISTFNGEPVVRVQLASNGYLPHEESLKDILSALIVAGRTEIIERQWLIKSRNITDPLSAMLIHVHGPLEVAPILKRITSAFAEMGASQRLLGPHRMLPLIANFGDIQDEALGFKVPSAKPLQLLKTRIAGASLAGRPGSRPSSPPRNEFAAPAP